MKTNPFSVGGSVDPKHFVGRQSAVYEAFDQISNNSHLAIWGSPGIGKSSYLRYLASPEAWQAVGVEDKQTCIIFLDCMSLHPFHPEKFWRAALDLLKSSEPELDAKISEVLAKNPTTKDDFRAMLRLLPSGKKLLLLVDDYDAALKTHDDYDEKQVMDFLLSMRSLANDQTTQQIFSTVVATSGRLSDLGPALEMQGSPWYNQYLFRRLKPFKDKEVDQLFEKMPEQWTLGSEERAAIRELADGQPLLLQNACYLLFRYRRDEETIVPDTFAREFADATEQFYKNTWSSAGKTEQMLMMLIALRGLEGRLNKQTYALSDVEAIFSQLERELREMESNGIVCAGDEENCYRFNSSMMEFWVIKEIENSTEEALAERQKVFFNMISHKQLGQVKNAMQYIWKNKDAVKSIVGWAGKLVGAFSKGYSGA